MAKDFRELPLRWEDARPFLQDFMREVTREASVTNMNGEVFTKTFVATVGLVINHQLGKDPVILQMLEQDAHGTLVMSAKSSTQVTVTCDVNITAKFRIE